MKKLSCILFILIAASVASAQSKGGWVNLFDGKTLNGWKKITGSADYKIEDGAIVGITVPNSPNTFFGYGQRIWRFCAGAGS